MNQQSTVINPEALEGVFDERKCPSEYTRTPSR